MKIIFLAFFPQIFGMSRFSLHFDWDCVMSRSNSSIYASARAHVLYQYTYIAQKQIATKA